MTFTKTQAPTMTFINFTSKKWPSEISPSKVMEDDQATLHQVLNDQITHQVSHLDVLLSSLHEHSLCGTFTPEYKNTHHMLADFNTKPSTGKSFQQKVQ